MRTRRGAPVIAVVAAASSLLAACADPSRESDAERLRDEVRTMPGVTAAELEYVAPVALDSGKLRLSLRLERGVSPDEAADVATTVYDALSTTHRREEGDVDVTFAGSTLHLRTFEPEAEAASVAREWRLAVDLASSHDVALDVTTQDVETGDHVRTQVEVALDDGTGAADVRRVLDELEAAHGSGDAGDATPQRGWGVAASDGSGVHRDEGFPTASTLSTWASLRAVALDASDLGERATVAVDLREVVDVSLRYVTVSVAGRDGPLDVVAGGDRLALLESGLAQLRRIREVDDPWVYDLQVDGAQAAFIDPDLCEPGATSDLAPLDQDLRTPANCPGPEPSDSP